MDRTLLELLTICGSLFLIAMLVAEIFEWIQLIIPLTSNYSGITPVLKFTNENLLYNSNIRINKHDRTDRSLMNIITRDCIVIAVSEPINWIGYSIQPTNMTLINDGKTLSINCIWSEELTPYIFGGPLKFSYKLNSMAFHWGLYSNIGSEHAFDSNQYPLEMQLFHVKWDLDKQVAIDVEDQSEITIISFFFKCSKNHNYVLDNITSKLSKVKCMQSKVSIEPFKLDTLFPQFKNKFYTYNGPSNTLSFIENVTWLIYPEPLNISEIQMTEFRKVCLLNPNKIKNSQCNKIFDWTVFFHE